MADYVSISKLYELFLATTGVCTDSREIREASMFFALKGENFDGNLYALSAIQKGAAWAVVDDESLASADCCLLVENSLDALQDLAKMHRQNLKAKIIAITGTNGKTTTKELVYSVLSCRYRTRATRGNLNNHIGVPLTLLETPINTEFLILEMGANHIGEIDVLCRIGAPDFGLITNIGSAHLEGFGSVEGVIKAKCELFNYLKSNQGTSFLNLDDEKLKKCAAIPDECIIFSSEQSSDNQVINLVHNPFLKLQFVNQQNHIEIESKLFGSYNALNIAAAATIGSYFDIDPLEIKKAIETYEPTNNRSQIKETAENTIIMDAYNANPSSLRKSISSFLSAFSKKRVLILGDMLELGEYSFDEHLKIVEMIRKANCELVILVGPEFKDLNSGFPSFENVDDTIDWIVQNPIKGKRVLVKGSRGIKLEKLYPLL